MEVSYTNNTSSATTVTARVQTAQAGTVYMDCVQIERAPTASRYNLVDNGDFRNTYSWSSTSGITTPTDLEAAAPELNNTVYSMTGSPASTNRISQTVNVSGSAGDTFVLAGWAKGDSAPLESIDTHNVGTREFGIIATFNNTDGTTTTSTVHFNPYTDSSVNWQYAAAPIVAEKAYSSITVTLAYDYNVNTVYFDGIQLYKEEFGNSYTYDENGNVISVKDLQGQTTTYAYTNNNLTSTTLPTGAKLTYTYDNYHNVLTASTGTGVVYNFAYDTYGNNTSVSIGSGTTKVTSSAAYTTDGNRLASTTDAAGKTTTYSYHADTNVLEWVQYPEDTTDTRTEYSYDTMYRLATAAADVSTGSTLTATYTYTDDLLSAIQTGSTTYSFSYGNFALRSAIKIGSRTLATYTYTDKNNYLNKLAYGNGDSVQYTYDNQGRVTKQTFETGDTVTYKYDNNGVLASLTDSGTGLTTTYYYDFTGRLMKYRENSSTFSHVSDYSYDDSNNLTELFDTILGVVYMSYYYYDSDNRISRVYDGGVQEDYTYDAYGRISTKLSTFVDKTVVTDTFTYRNPTTSTTSSQVATMKTSAATYNVTYNYTYDDNGNILSISDGTNTTSYVYDSANQLTRENNQAAGKTWVWTYDDAGNITSRKEYAYTTGTLGTATDTAAYTYGDSSWGDLLTGYDGNTITSDTIGNMTSDGTWTYTWERGRQLASMTDGTTTWNYSYNNDGMRYQRTDGTTTYTYFYNGDLLRYLDINGTKLYFVLDASGQPIEVSYVPAGTTYTQVYYYVMNLQGDVTAIINTAGYPVVQYTYDAWGNVLSITGGLADTLGVQNPFRYRGYVYDSDTGLYYLQSRYYDPEMGRFINVDVQVSTGQGILGFNMFSYCNNNPVRYVDTYGREPTEAVDTDGDGIPDYYQYDYTYTYTEWIGFLFFERTISGSVYIFPDIGSTSNLDATDTPDGFNSRYDLMVGYYVDTRDGHDNPVMYAYQAQLTDIAAMYPIVEVMQQYDRDFNTAWKRSSFSLYHEWECHKEFSIHPSAQNVDFDNDEEGKTRIGYYWKAFKRIFGLE